MSAVGTYITDGTVTWIIEDATQVDAVGDITLHPTLLAGHVLANGATVKASEYPRLLQWVQENSMTGTDAAHYVYDASADTLKLPNAIGRVLQGAANIAAKAAGLPNITGNLCFAGNRESIDHFRTNGVFGFTYKNSILGLAPMVSKIDGDEYANFYAYHGVDINASRSSSIYGASTTVQPPAITLLAQIKY